MNPINWLSGQIEDLTDEIRAISPSEWAEENRRLPDGQALPGPYDYGVTPYLLEIVNCLDRRSPVRKISIMKGAQTGGTVGVAENGIGYWISHIKTAPILLVTATQALAAIRMEEYLTPMIEQSGLSDAIQSNSDNKRKSGNTARKISWRGGGFLVPTGSNEAANLRSVSFPNIVLDEVDSYPIRVGRDGDPGKLAERRSASYAKSKKVLLISTPTTTEESRIAKEFESGDQRVYKMPCRGCGEFIEFRWRYDDKEGNQIGGVIWNTTDEGNVEPGSVRYACHHCGECHINEHKREMLKLGRWEATATPKHPSWRSYHISALIAPPDFYSWEDAVVDWLDAWDVGAKAARDVEKLQEFYNNVLGRTYRTAGSRLTVGKVARHQREYLLGRVPNEIAETMYGGKVGYLTCTADVHKTFISATVMGWAPNRGGFLIDRYTFEGATDDPFDASGPWGRMDDLIAAKFPDGQGREYPVKVTLIDSGYNTSEVYAFCGQYESAVYPIKGDDMVRQGANREFKRLTEASKSGVDGWLINVNHYKSRLAAVLRASPKPDTESAMVDSVSFPMNISDEALKELTAEEFIRKPSGRWEWKRIHARNELWDLTVYNSAARDITAFMLMREHFDLDVIDWAALWPLIDGMRFGWVDVPAA
jgi:phage terminase large subunit GpA-like protein